jgi:hypothetical protein
MTGEPKRNGRQYGVRSGSKPKFTGRNDRMTAGFEYIGPKRFEDAKKFGLKVVQRNG